MHVGSSISNSVIIEVPQNQSLLINSLDLDGRSAKVKVAKSDPLSHLDLDLTKYFSLIMTQDGMYRRMPRSLLYQKLKLLQLIKKKEEHLSTYISEPVNIPLPARTLDLIGKFWSGIPLKEIITEGAPPPLNSSEELENSQLYELRISELLLAAGYFNEREILDSRNTIETIRDIIAPHAPLSFENSRWILENPSLNSEEQRNSIATLLALLFWTQAQVHLEVEIGLEEYKYVNLLRFLCHYEIPFPLRFRGLCFNDRVSGLAKALKENKSITSLEFFFHAAEGGAITALVEAIREKKCLISIIYHGNDTGVEGAKAMVQILKVSESITRLNISDKIGDEGVKVLAEMLKGNKSITSLTLMSNNIGDEGAKALAEALEKNTSITSLNLGYNSIGVEGATALAKLLKENNSITSLDISHNGIGVEGAKALAEALEKNTKIISLDLTNNYIRDGGAKALAEALMVNTRITSLKLCYNHIGDEGVKALAEALKVNKSITSLDLGIIDLGGNRAKVLAEALKVNKSITSLKLKGFSIRDKQAEALAEALKVNKSITSLDLKHNNIGIEGATALANLLKDNNSITSLSFNNSTIGDDGAKAFAEVLVVNKSITCLDLEYNAIGNEGAEALVKAVMKNESITSLRLNDRGIGGDGAKALAEALVALKVNRGITIPGLWYLGPNCR